MFSILIGSIIVGFLGGNNLFAFLGVVFLAFGMGLNNAAVFKIVPKVLPQAVGGASGLIGGLGALGGFVIPPILGKIADMMVKSGYYTGFFVFTGLAITGIIFIFILQSRMKN
jgi:NNP family nitrate/nitrite transporter-like MFS transporter